MPILPEGDAISRIAGLARSYLDADYRWELAGDWHDVRVGLPAPGLEMAHPDASSFGFLSAWNPMSIERPEEENRTADHALHDALLASGLPFRAGFASAPNRSWREPSWITMGMEVAQFDTLARQFGQLGTLWWPSNAPVRMRMHAQRPHDMQDDRYIDWLK